MTEVEREFILRADTVAGIDIRLILRVYEKTLQPDYAILLLNPKTAKSLDTRDFQHFYMADAEYDYIVSILYLVGV